MITRRSVLTAALAGVTAGCATPALAPQGAYKAADAFQVTLPRAWSDLTNMLVPRPPGVRMLSQDGPLLNRLYVAAIAQGESLWRPRDSDTPRATYRTDMSDTELVEFVIDCIAVEYQDPQSSALRPQAIAGVAGVRFDIAARTAQGLDMSGTALVAHGANGKLLTLLYLAPSEHYYAALLPEVEQIFASAAAAG